MPKARIEILCHSSAGPIRVPVQAQVHGALAVHRDIQDPRSRTALTHIRSGRQVHRGSAESCRLLLDLLAVRKWIDWEFDGRGSPELQTVIEGLVEDL